MESIVPIAFNYGRKPRTDVAISELAKVYGEAQAEWEGNEACKTLKQGLLVVENMPWVTKIVAFALGSVQEDSNPACPEHLKRRSCMQHALMETLTKVVEQAQGAGGKVTQYVQDPGYGSADLELLRQLDVTPLEDPDGFIEIDDHNLVLSISSNVPVKQVVADLQWPAVLIIEPIDLTRTATDDVAEVEAPKMTKTLDGEDLYVA